MRIYNIFNSFLLRLAANDLFPNQIDTERELEALAEGDKDAEYRVDAVVASR